jgi:glycosyltransferase involved in cell wall biosynthesis
VTALRVAVPADRAEQDPGSGAGRVWTTVISELRGRGVEVEPRTTRARRMPSLRRRVPDVWLVPGDFGQIDVPAPVVAIVHGAAWPLEPDFFDYVPRAFAEPSIAAVEATLASASFAIAPSEYTRRGIAATGHIEPEQVAVVPHGVDLDAFAPSRAGGRGEVQRAFGQPRPYVLFASIPSIPQKNLGALRAAMASLVAEGRPHALVIGGGPAGGESAEELAAIDADLPGVPGRVAWLGHVDDHTLAGLMAECAAFCLPSLFEAFGLTALEAMACGAPVVVSNRGALPEVVGEAGIATPPTPAELERALARVLDDSALAASLGDAARRRAESMSWRRTADGWLAALEHAAASA